MKLMVMTAMTGNIFVVYIRKYLYEALITC